MDQILATAQEWATMDPNPVTGDYVRKLIAQAQNGEQELKSLFPIGRRIGFGTAGLRAAMQPGPMSMNELTVLQTAQGLAKYCQRHSKNPIVVIGYDHRSAPQFQMSSVSFAIITALVLQHAGIKSLLLDGFVATPMVPFAMSRVDAVAGIMITASHNPKDDNGYKVYASDGCQIRSPMDSEIAADIENNLKPWTDYASQIRELQARHSDPCLGLSENTAELKRDYFQALQSLCTHQAKNPVPAPPKFVYSAMHGVGYPFAQQVFESFGLPPFAVVPEQQEPNAQFPTVAFPNPEERGALDLSQQYAEQVGGDIVLANDPDADRLAVAERDRTTGEWTLLTGDQIGTLLGHWLWTQIGVKSEKPVSMCASTVSSKMLQEIARVEGFHFEDTLTGFKWIGSRSAELQKTHLHLFGYEEAIGFCCGNVIFDKDGISAMAVFAELALWVYRQGGTLRQHLQSLYDRYGEFVSSNGYFFLQDMAVVPQIMKRIRGEDGKYNSVNLQPYQMDSIRDLMQSYDSSQPDHKATLPSTPLLTLRFTNGCVLQLRPSGTEPKLKYYMEMKGAPGVPREVVSKELKEMAAIVLERLLEPEKNGLTRPSH